MEFALYKSLLLLLLLHAAFYFTRFVEFNAVSVSCESKRMMKISIYYSASVFLETSVSLAQTRPLRHRLQRGKTSQKYDDSNLRLCWHPYTITIYIRSDTHIFENSLKIAKAILKVQISPAFVRLLFYQMTN